MDLMQNISLAFTAGCLGGLVNSLAVWLAGAVGLTRLVGVKLAPAFTMAWLYPRLVWGGLFGLLLVLTGPRRSPWGQGLALSLPPSLVQLCVVFPFQLGKGWLGLELGLMTPVLVLLFNAVWGVAAAGWYAAAKGGRDY
jgi:hypothetical protein